jgi:hypothetical protein
VTRTQHDFTVRCCPPSTAVIYGMLRIILRHLLERSIFAFSLLLLSSAVASAIRVFYGDQCSLVT